MIKLGIVGNPVLASLSPVLHQRVNHQVSYLRLAAKDGRHALSFAEQLGLAGINVTAPFKSIGSHLDHLDQSAQITQAVNTVLWRGGSTHGFNTDVAGVRGALAGIDLGSKMGVILGAGGAARAAAAALAGSGVILTIINRDEQKAASLAADFGLNWARYEQAPDLIAHCDLVISCLSASTPVLPASCWQPGQIVLDAKYHDSWIARIAHARGAHVIDGREWLLHQGVQAHVLFTGYSPTLRNLRMAMHGDEERGKAIALIGIMGSGKTTVAAALAARTSARLLDTDEMIATDCSKSIAEIFAQQGEAGFRCRERLAVTAATDQADQDAGVIIATGGGVVTDHDSILRLRQAATVVWLWCRPVIAAGRIGNDPRRPMLSQQPVVDQLQRLLQQRQDSYAAACHLVIDASDASPDQIAERIVSEVHCAR